MIYSVQENNIVKTYKTYREHKKEALKDPELKAEYDALEPEFKLAVEMIDARLAQKLTQEELAEKAGVTQNTIARLESGTTNPTIGTISRVASALGKEIKLVGA
jgi:DNA-binding XRE family transcriptional regulator